MQYILLARIPVSKSRPQSLLECDTIVSSCEYDAYNYIYTCTQGAVLGPGEFFEGLALGGREFFSSTVGKDG